MCRPCPCVLNLCLLSKLGVQTVVICCLGHLLCCHACVCICIPVSENDVCENCLQVSVGCMWAEGVAECCVCVLTCRVKNSEQVRTPQSIPSHPQRGGAQKMFPANLGSQKEIDGRREPGIFQASRLFAIYEWFPIGQREGLILTCENRWTGTWQDNDTEQRCPSVTQAPRADSEGEATRWDYGVSSSRPFLNFKLSVPYSC